MDMAVLMVALVALQAGLATLAGPQVALVGEMDPEVGVMVVATDLETMVLAVVEAVMVVAILLTQAALATSLAPSPGSLSQMSACTPL
jgi:hypothetical protein